ncbi:hypothetical protein EJB05_05473, partial [Eragrostis curvula]
MTLAKRRRGERAGSRAAKRQDRTANPQGQRLYLIFDDWPWGYSIREVNLSPPTSHQTQPAASGKGAVRRLPEAFIRLEAPRGHAMYFSAVGTRIVATHPRNSFDEEMDPDGFVPIVDVRSRGVTFGPGQLYPDDPIFLPVGAGLYALDICRFSMLSLEPLWPPRLENPFCSSYSWLWGELPTPPFDRVAITFYAVHADEQTILISTDSSYLLHNDQSTEGAATDERTAESDAAVATFTFNTKERFWKRLSEWTLPFHGRAHFVHCLKAFVGLSKDPATQGHLCACEVTATDLPPAWKLSKEKLFSEEPAETHVGATLVYMGGSKFCLVQCVSIEDDNSDDLEHLEEKGDGIADGQEQLKEGDGIADGQEQLEGEGDGIADGQEQLEGEGDGIADGPEQLEGEGDGTADGQEQLKEGDNTADEEQLEEGDGTVDQEQLEEGDDTAEQEELKEGGEVPRCPSSYIYRLTTFSLGYDDNGDLTTGESCRVQCYKVPEETTERFFQTDPVAFWL